MNTCADARNGFTTSPPLAEHALAATAPVRNRILCATPLYPPVSSRYQEFWLASHFFSVTLPPARCIFSAALSVCLPARVSAKGPKKDLVRRGSTMLFSDNLVRAVWHWLHFAGRFILVFIFDPVGGSFWARGTPRDKSEHTDRAGSGHGGFGRRDRHGLLG